MGVNSSRRNKAVARNRIGKHRVRSKRHVEPYTLLGAGVITLGLGAAMAGGVGIANAESGPDSASTPSDAHAESQVSASAGDAKPTKNDPESTPVSVVGARRGDVVDRKKNESAAKNKGSSQKVWNSFTSVSTSDGKLKTKADAFAAAPSLVGSANSESKTPTLVASREVQEPAGLDHDGGGAAQPKSNPPAAVEASEARPAATALQPTILGTQLEPEKPSEPAALHMRSVAARTALPNGVQTLALAAAAAAVDPARAAYIKQFKDVDPTGQFYTPASPDWATPVPPNYTDEQYRAFVAEQITQSGTTGFKQTATGGLQYTNTTSQTVAVLYGAKAGGYVEPAGIRVVRPGQTVVLPGQPQGAVAAAVSTRAASPGGFGTQLAVAAVGYPPFTATSSTGSSSPIKTQTSGSSLITKVNSILKGNDFQTLVSNLGDLSAIAGFKTFSTAANLVGGLVSGYKGDFVGTALSAIEAAGNGVMATAAKTKNPFLYLVGTAITTTSYTLNLAAHSDFSDPGSTARYAVSHPGVVIQETAKAAGQVLGHLGSAVVGSFGGVLKIFR